MDGPATTKNEQQFHDGRYICSGCDYITMRKGNFQRHLCTVKHHVRCNGAYKKKEKNLKKR